MNQNPDGIVSPDDAARLLNSPPGVFQALAMSGLLGYWSDGGIPLVAIEQFRKYGTQWRSELGKRSLGPEPYQNLPVAVGTLGGEQPPSTLTEVQIAPGNVLPEHEDTGWLAQFYLRANPFFFPDPTSLALIGPLPLKLSTGRAVPGTSLPTYVFPDPDGALAMVMVIGNPKPEGNPFHIAYDVASPLLDELSLRYDQPLPVAQSIIVGIPSGSIHVHLPKTPKLSMITPDVEITPACPYPDLRDAVALYREGISSNNPFHQFLTLWKVHENVIKLRSLWRTREKRKDLKITPEIIPDMFAFGEFSGLTFDKARQKLNTPYRVALAHGDVQGGKPRTPASALDYNDVAAQVPLVRYMSRVVIENFRATLERETSAK